MTSDIIKIGDYIVIQKQNYRKLHKFNKPNSTVNVGRDSVNLGGIDGCRYFSVFKLIGNVNNIKKQKEFTLQLTDEAVKLKDEIDVKVSGNDNRNIFDDGLSQKLSAADIEELRSDATKAADIVETLISNSSTFHSKTEFSQEKYLKKKEKKYFEYLQIIKPTLRIIADIMYKLEAQKIQNLRVDTLSQIMTSVNIYSEGNYLLYDSGSNGLLAAALLSVIGQGTTGKLVHMHPGNMSQKQALLAMNFADDQLKRCISVNVYSVLRLLYQGCDTNSQDNCDITKTIEPNPLKRKSENDLEHQAKMTKYENCEIPQKGDTLKGNDNVKVKDSEGLDKKPKWHYDNITASELLQNKMDALVIACKEDPENIYNELVKFVKPSRPFVIYNIVAEPLQNLYMTLKSQSNVGALKLTCNWMRNHQVSSIFIPFI